MLYSLGTAVLYSLGTAVLYSLGTAVLHSLGTAVHYFPGHCSALLPWALQCITSLGTAVHYSLGHCSALLSWALQCFILLGTAVLYSPEHCSALLTGALQCITQRSTAVHYSQGTAVHYFPDNSVLLPGQQCITSRTVLQCITSRTVLQCITSRTVLYYFPDSIVLLLGQYCTTPRTVLYYSSDSSVLLPGQFCITSRTVLLPGQYYFPDSVTGQCNRAVLPGSVTGKSRVVVGGEVAPRGSNALGQYTDPYRYVVHTATRLPWVHPVHHRTAVHTTSGMPRGREQAPGLNGPVSYRARGTQGTVPWVLFLYLRLFWPGS